MLNKGNAILPIYLFLPKRRLYRIIFLIIISMNKLIQKPIILLIALLLISPFFSCSKDKDEGNKNLETIFDPIAGFSYQAINMNNQVKVVFTNTSLRAQKYLWKFGYNNSQSQEVNPTFYYPKLSQPASYLINLKATDTASKKDNYTSQTIQIPALGK